MELLVCNTLKIYGLFLVLETGHREKGHCPLAMGTNIFKTIITAVIEKDCTF